MEPNHKILPIDFLPSRNEFIFNEIKISSKFDSGNLLDVNRVNENTVRIKNIN